MKLSKLSNEGIDAFIDFLDNINEIDVSEKRKKILELSEVVGNIECKSVDKFPQSKIEAAKYLSELLIGLNFSVVRDRGLWAWLSLYYFDVICNKDSHKQYKVGSINRWIPVFDNFHKYYRHLLAGPWDIFKVHKGNVKSIGAVLSGKITTQGDLFEQFASRQELISCSSIMTAATKMYFDENKHVLKKGAGGKGPGSPRRFAATFQQFSRTFDFYEMDYEDVLGLLPKEFNKFLGRTGVITSLSKETNAYL
jgi:hypothetical protein